MSGIKYYLAQTAPRIASRAISECLLVGEVDEDGAGISGRGALSLDTVSEDR